MNRKITIIVGLLTFLALSTCNLACKTNKEVNYRIYDIRIYKDTPVWELALAVKWQRKSKIEKLVKKNPHWLNYQEPKYGATLQIGRASCRERV